MVEDEARLIPRPDRIGQGETVCQSLSASQTEASHAYATREIHVETRRSVPAHVAVGLAVAVGHTTVLHVLAIDSSVGLVDKIRVAPVLLGNQTCVDGGVTVSFFFAASGCLRA